MNVTSASSRRSPIALSPREMSVACAFVLIVFAAGVALTAAQSPWFPRSDAWKLGGDFIELYSAGRVLHDGKADRLYDLELEAELNRELVPGAAELRRAFAYPPFVAILFQPLAALPFSRGLAAFLVATPLLYAGALTLLVRTFGPEARDERALALLAGLSFFSFLGYTWLGAQISVIGVAAVSLAVAAEHTGRALASGLALSLCLYKPSLLVLLVPMLAATGRWRALAGFALGGSALALVCLLFVGAPATSAFFDTLMRTIDRSMTSENLFNAYRYVDLNAFFRLLPAGRSLVGYAILGAIVAAALVAIVRTWLRSRADDPASRMLVWATTLTWSLVLNIYMPLYDTLLVVPAAVLTVAALRARHWQGWNRIGPALACLYLAAWITEVFSRTFRVQLYTLVLAAFGTLLLIEANRQPPMAASGLLQTADGEQRR